MSNIGTNEVRLKADIKASIRAMGTLSIGTNNLSSIKYLSSNNPSDVKTLVVKEGL